VHRAGNQRGIVVVQRLLSNETYSIPKRELTVRVTLKGQAPAFLKIFLGPDPSRPSGFEKASDVLNGAPRFLPAKDERGQIVFLHRDAIALVSISTEDEREDLEADHADTGFSTHRGIEVTLDDGSTLAGNVVYIMPEARRRLQDYLNTEDRFLELRLPQVTHLINKRRILRVSQLPARVA
jgi:hypothetical protein